MRAWIPLAQDMNQEAPGETRDRFWSQNKGVLTTTSYIHRHAERIQWIYAAAITLLGTCLRIQWVLHIPTEPVYDFATYQAIATNIFLHKGHTYLGQPIAFQGVAYPYALGLVYRLVGNNHLLTGQWFNVVLSTLTLPVLYFLIKRLAWNRFVLNAAYTTVVLLPNYIAYVSVIGTEVFLTFLYALVLLLQVYPFRNPVRYPLLGILIGIAALAKPMFLAYPVLVALTQWLTEKDWKRTLVCLLSLFLFMAITIAPWAYRNQQAYHRFIPVTYNSGYVLYLNNNANNVSGGWMPIHDASASPELRAQVDAVLAQGYRSEKLAYELDELLRPAAKAWIASHPGEFLKLGLMRVKLTFFGGAWDLWAWAMNGVAPPVENRAQWERTMNLWHALCDTIIYVLSSCGFLCLALCIRPVLGTLLRQETRLPVTVLLPALNLAFFVAVYFVFEGQPRYNFPALLLLAICFAYCLEWIRCGVAHAQQ